MQSVTVGWLLTAKHSELCSNFWTLSVASRAERRGLQKQRIKNKKKKKKKKQREFREKEERLSAFPHTLPSSSPNLCSRTVDLTPKYRAGGYSCSVIATLMPPIADCGGLVSLIARPSAPEYAWCRAGRRERQARHRGFDVQ